MNLLRQLQDELKALIVAQPEFANASVLVEDTEDLQSKIDQGLAKLGLAILVGNPSLQSISEEDGREEPAFMEARIPIGVAEQPLLWRKIPGRPTCMDAASIVCRKLVGFQPSNPYFPVKFLTAAPSASLENGRQIYELEFAAKLVLPD